MAAARRARGDNSFDPGKVSFQRQNPPPTTAQLNISEEDDGGYPLKRRRVSRACDRCRQSKLKCNGAMPKCGTCLEARKSCSYGATMRRRGLRTGYVRALEWLWGVVFQSIEGSEDAVEKLISRTSKRGFWVREELRDGPKTEDSPMEAWKASRIPRSIDDLLSASEDLEDDQTAVSPILAAQTKDTISWTLSENNTSHPDEKGNGGSKSYCERCHKCTQEPAPAPIFGLTGTSQVGEETRKITQEMNRGLLSQLPQNPQKLLDQYFALTHTWFPVVERHAVYRSLFAYRKRLAHQNIEDNQSGDNAILWALLAYATMLENLSPSPELATPSLPSEDLYVTARRLIPLEKEDKYSIGHVQALLILGLLHYSSRQWSIAQIMIGQAILLATHLGLDQYDQCLTEYHRRTWLGCFVLDTLVSAHTGKGPRLRPQSVQTFLPADETGNEEWEPWRLQEKLLPNANGQMTELATLTHSLSVFNELVNLLCIFNDWMCSTASDMNGKCKQALQWWQESLSEHIRSVFNLETSPTTSPPAPPNILNLYMVYNLIDARLSSATSPRTPLESFGGRGWQWLIQTTDVFLRCFHPQTLPPSFNLLRTILASEMVEDFRLLEIINELKMRILPNQLQRVFQDPDVLTNNDAANLAVSQTLQKIWPAANTHVSDEHDLSNVVSHPSFGNMNIGPKAYNLDPRIEQKFGSFIDMPTSWINVADGLLLGSQERPLDVLDSTLCQADTTTIHSGEMPSNPSYTEDQALAWDDLETQHQDQFTRNLGFTF